MADNSLLVNFGFLVDLDLATYKYMKNQYYNSNPDIFDKEFMNIKDDIEIIDRMLYRKFINPIELMIPNKDVSNMYEELLSGDNYKSLLDISTVYDTYPLMITIYNNASSVDITMRCDNKYEEEYIKSLNSEVSFKTIIAPRKEIDLSEYTAIYDKYFSDLFKYKSIKGKHVYIANARYNMDPERDCLNIGYSIIFGDVNDIKIMDLYRYNKFSFDYLEE